MTVIYSPMPVSSDAVLVYSSTDAHNFAFPETTDYAAAIDAYMDSRETREIRSVMHQRTGVCG